ncbi:MAG: hypothetical protein RR406_03920 [Bacilli bacterium]
MKKRIIYVSLGLLLITMLGLLVYYFMFKGSNQDLIDNKKFSEEYPVVDQNNVFVYRNINEIIDIMQKGTGVVYLGFPECPWCHAYVKYLNEVAKESGITKVYYYNILKDRKNNTEEYQKIVELLADNLQFDQEGKHKLYVPNVSFHINGKIIGNDYETSLDTHHLKDPALYWTDSAVASLKSRLKVYMDAVALDLNSCTSCNK